MSELDRTAVKSQDSGDGNGEVILDLLSLQN